MFDDPYLIVVEDCEDEQSELRFHAIGRTGSEVLLLVVYMDRSGEDQAVIRIISARKANAYEESTYSDQF